MIVVVEIFFLDVKFCPLIFRFFIFSEVFVYCFFLEIFVGYFLYFLVLKNVMSNLIICLFLVIV